jgi:hypothetical protein
VQRTVEACELAREAAAIAAEGIATGSMSRLNASGSAKKNSMPLTWKWIRA